MSLKIAFAWQFLPFSQLPWHNLPHNLIQFLLHLLEFASRVALPFPLLTQKLLSDPASLYVNSDVFASTSTISPTPTPVGVLSKDAGAKDLLPGRRLLFRCRKNAFCQQVVGDNGNGTPKGSGYHGM